MDGAWMDGGRNYGGSGSRTPLDANLGTAVSEPEECSVVLGVHRDELEQEQVAPAALVVGRVGDEHTIPTRGSGGDPEILGWLEPAVLEDAERGLR